MLTSTAPTWAAANCTTTHCGQFVAQMPTCSPRSTPSASRARATRADFVVERARSLAIAELGKHQGVVTRMLGRGLRQDLCEGQAIDPGRAVRIHVRASEFPDSLLSSRWMQQRFETGSRQRGGAAGGSPARPASCPNCLSTLSTAAL